MSSRRMGPSARGRRRYRTAGGTNPQRQSAPAAGRAEERSLVHRKQFCFRLCDSGGAGIP